MFSWVDLGDGESFDAPSRRERMTRDQVLARGVTERAVLDALNEVPRHRFVPPALVVQAYEDHPVAIGHGQTISQPYIVGYMLALVARPGMRALEIGTGCGYQAAVLSRLATEVHTVEIVPELAARAARRLDALGFKNVTVHVGDGAEGWKEAAPYDAIVVSCGAPRVPRALVEQLAPGGRLICPIGDPSTKQQLVLVEKDMTGRTSLRPLIAVRFVPLTGPSGAV